MGLSGAVFHAPLIHSAAGLNLVKVVTSNPAAVQKDYPGVDVASEPESLIGDSDIDLVIVASPNATHFTYAKMALEAGKHVVVEKPFVNRVQEADELIALAARNNRLLSVFHNRRWDNDFLTVQKCVDEGMLGDIYYYEAHYDRFRPQVSDKWKEHDLAGSGVLYDLGPHLIDQAIQLLGLPQTISAEILKQRPGAQAPDYFHLILGYGQRRVVLHASCLVKNPGPRFQVHGNKGSLIKYGLDPQEEDLKRGIRPGDPGWGKDKAEWRAQLTLGQELSVQTRLETIPGSYESYYAGIHDAIITGGPEPVMAPEARNVIKVIEYAIESHRQQRVIPWQA